MFINSTNSSFRTFNLTDRREICIIMEQPAQNDKEFLKLKKLHSFWRQSRVFIDTLMETYQEAAFLAT